MKEAGGSSLNLKTVHNAGQNFKKLNPDVRVLGAKEPWLDQLDDCFDRLQSQGEDTLSAKLHITRNIDEEKSYAIAFAKRSRLSTLMRRGHLVLMDSTHNKNQLKWKLFTVMLGDEHGSWIPSAHILTDHEDGDIIEEFLRQIKRWTRAWRLRYIITDDLAAEQREVSLAFWGLIDGEIEVSHFLCRTHSERTLNRKLAGVACKKAKKDLYDALYFRKTEMGCDDSLKRAMKSVPMEKRQYIEREWVLTKRKWANYARQHSCLLLQCMTTNAVESWHTSLKKHADGKFSLIGSSRHINCIVGKASCMTFSLIGAASHVIRVGDQWENRTRQEAINFHTTMTPECQECPQLRKFPYPVQKLIVDQWKLAAKELADGDMPAGELPDELICPVDCFFWRRYQLPCKHLWHYNIVCDAFQQNNWTVWAEMIEDSGFEIYETSARLEVECHEEIEGVDRHMVQMREVLDAIKEKYYKIIEHTAEWTAEERSSQM